jgi:hypothetical protein
MQTHEYAKRPRSTRLARRRSNFGNSYARLEVEVIHMRTKSILAVSSLALASATLCFADEWNRKIEFTFNKAVSIPAVHQPGWGVLPPGKYVFKIFDSSSNRHIVQIFNKDETDIFATILAIPNTRLKITDDAVITFRETPAGQPLALRAMFYPGRAWGEEFVYPKARATELARATSQPVLSMPAAMEKEAAKPAEPQVIAELEKTPLTAVRPSGEEVQTAEVVAPPTPADFQAATPAEALPATASPLPLFALLGLLGMGAGWTLRFVEKRIG